MFWVLVEVTMGSIVFCADSVANESDRPMRDRVLRSMLWPLTLGTWFTHRTLAKLARFGGIVWLAVTTGWLLSLERDRITDQGAFLLVAEGTMAFVVYCVDAMSADVEHRPLLRVVRSVVWVKAISEYLRDDDAIRLIQATVTVWVLLTAGWLLGLESDRISRPLARLAR